MTYEGARSILGPYTSILGGTVLVAGFLALGDLIGYLTRAGVGGFLHHVRNPKLYWGIVYAGYLINLGAVPLLAIVGRWEEAFILVLLERIGKGLRATARDIIMSEVTRNIGVARGFALHEFMDQLGAVSGPLILAFTIPTAGVRGGLKLLAIPAVLAIGALTVAYLNYPAPAEARVEEKRGALTWREHLIVAGLGISIAVLPIWPVLTYAWTTGIAAFAYSVAMGVDAVAALVAGELEVRAGVRGLVVLPLIGILSGYMMPLSVYYGDSYAIIITVVWGLFMGFFEVYSRSGVAIIVPTGKRSLAYGLLGFYSALGLLLSGIVYGGIYYSGLTWLMFIAPILLASPSVISLVQALEK
jgi:hypothetical protein